MRGALLLALLSTIAGAVSCAESATPKNTPPVAVVIKTEKRTPEIRDAIAQTFQGTNQLRIARGRTALGSSPELTMAAGSFAQFLADKDVLGHDADGSDPATRAARAGYESCIVAENIAYQFLSTGFSTEELVQTLLDGWMDSTGHRDNLLDPDITEIGVGIARSPRSGKYYAVQLFGRPQALRIEFTIRNSTQVALRFELGRELVTLPAGTKVSYMLCRATKLVFRWPGKQSTSTITAENAQDYVLNHLENGNFQVGKAAAF